VDVLADLLHRARARDGVFARSVLTPPWGLRFADAAPLSVEVVIRGQAWITPADGEPIALHQGDLAIVQGCYVLADDPATEPGAVLYGDGRSAAAGEPPRHDPDRWRLPTPRTFGDLDGPTVIVRSAYRLHGSIGHRLLDALPKALRVPADALPRSARELLDAEIGRDAPGQQTVLDRLLDLLLVLGLRAWLGRPEATPPAWYRALADPPIGRALQLLHADPGRPWTVASLAAEAGLSRAGFARRFTELLGEGPIGYLTRWRIDLAADLLANGDATVAAVARQVGYADAFALSTAMKRVTGRSPTDHRLRSAPRS